MKFPIFFATIILMSVFWALKNHETASKKTQKKNIQVTKNRPVNSSKTNKRVKQTQRTTNTKTVSTDFMVEKNNRMINSENSSLENLKNNVELSNGQSIDLRKTKKNAIFSQLSNVDQFRLKRTVTFYCQERYEKKSCLNYLIICGHDCINSVEKQYRWKVISDYKSLLNERKLK